ncbi:hypothetical protein H312_00252 [Anncaliia algerae PRA339]|uniref:Uncharacterized protein n=1 Tax=Anncaliia algerae PRA339 TaxID=1288291 RepID=A0A059F5G4_9MICR|nr:hypothetical protein H312_00252 [Anncaliia algerae PRA339]
MSGKNKIKEIANQVKNSSFVEKNTNLIKEIFSNEDNLESLYELIASDNNYDYLELAKKFYISIPSKYIIKSLKYRCNLTPPNYYLYFSLFSKKLINCMHEIRKHFDKKLIREAETKCLTGWMGRNRYEMRKKIEASFLAPDNEVEHILKSMDINKFLGKTGDMTKKIEQNFDFSLSFNKEDISFDFAFKKDEILVLINFDFLLFSRNSPYHDSTREKALNIYNDLKYQWIDKMEENETASDYGMDNTPPNKVIKTPNSASEKKINNFEFRRDYRNICFPSDDFFQKMDVLYFKNKHLITDEFITRLDKSFDYRISRIRDFIYELREMKVKFYCFTKLRCSYFVSRLITYGLNILKKEEVFFLTENSADDDIVSIFNSFKKVYIFEIRYKVYDSYIGRTDYCTFRDIKSFIGFLHKKNSC